MAINQDNRDYISRLNWLRLTFVVVIGTLVLRHWDLAVLEYRHYENLARKNHVRTVPVRAPRGVIRDRNGQVLVENIYGFDLLLFREELPDLDATRDFLLSGLELTEPQFDARLKEASHYSIYRPVVLKEGLTMEEISFLLSHRSDRPEIGIFKQPRRVYRHGSVGAHVLGYVGEISRDELLQKQFEHHTGGDFVGKYGLEKTYHRRLVGVNGERRVVVDSRGREHEELTGSEPIEGQEIELTLDLDLQRAAEDALGDSPGAVVALDPSTGEVLVMASRPAFDPNEFATHMSAEEWNALVENPDHPLQNRAIQATFSPGSIFKVVLALAGLHEGVANPSKRVFCPGSIEIYNHPFRCWNAAGHGWMDVESAIRHSCNVYFYLMGKDLGIDRISQFSRLVGLGQQTGLDLIGENAGLVPSREWKRRAKGEPWYPGETISVSIGQGPFTVTPVQLARAIGIVATGKKPNLHLVATGFDEGAAVESARLPFSDEHLSSVRNAMWQVVNAGGTGSGARVEGFDVCGKTGTVQTISNATRQKLTPDQAKRFEPHAWFVGFAPRDNPEIVVAVIVQRGGSGGRAAAPIAGQVFDLFRKKQLSRMQVVHGSGATHEAAPQSP